jgi:hypothetical protein
MTNRFGGRFSPKGSAQAPSPPSSAKETPLPNAFAGQRPHRARGRTNMLFFAPTPLLFTAFTAGPVGLAIDLCAFGILMLAAWMTREGLTAQDAYDARKVSRRPAIPRKLFGSGLMAAGLALASFAPDTSLLNPVIIGALGFGLHLFSFGLDPMEDKGMEGIDSFQQDRVAKAVTEAEQYLSAMSDAIIRAGDRTLVERVARFQATARTMFRTIEDDPRDLTGARKYLSVYLLGARDATSKFADIYGRNGDAVARSDFEQLLDDLERTFTARTEKMLEGDRTDLDIEIEVLRERLEREGVHHPKSANQ